MRPDPPRPSLLCVCNYPANTGYAWDFIESLYAALATRLSAEGIRTFVAYPRIDEAPRTLIGSTALPVALDATFRSAESVRATTTFVRDEQVAVLYLTDRPVRSTAYLRLRLAGLRRIVVHDHSSGARSVPTGVRRLVKWGLARLPWMVADHVVAVSQYVARRQVQTGLVPADRVTLVWNGVVVPPAPDPDARPLHRALGLPHNRRVVACACRAAPEKGVPVLLRAFDLMRQTWPGDRPAPALVYMGNGPQFEEIKATRESLASKDDIILTGYRSDALALVAGADVCAMPSLWQDALPLAVMQPMSLGRPVVASAVGGIPEMIVDGESGLLVPAGDERALAAALERLVADAAFAARLGTQARERVANVFTLEHQIDQLAAILRVGFPAASAAAVSTERSGAGSA